MIAKYSVAASGREREREYWLKKLARFPGKTCFPVDYNRKGREGEVSASEPFVCPAALAEGLLKLGTGSDARLHMVLVAGLSALLHRFLLAYAHDDDDRDMENRCNDIVIGTPILKPDVKGKFINTVLTLRNWVESDMAFKDLLLKVKDTVSEAVAHQNYPVEILAERLGLSYSPGDEFPLFDIALMLEGIHDKKCLEHVRLNMIFSFRRSGNEITGQLFYNESLYRKSTINGIIRLFMVDLRYNDSL